MGILFETPLIVRREDDRGNGKNKSRKTIDTDELRCCQRFQPFLQFCEVYFCHRCWLKVFKSTQYKALYVNILCQAFPQETRSHMIYHVIKGDWGRFPQQAAFWIMGPECPACLFLFDIFMDLIKRPTPWFSFINPMIYNELRHYSTMFSQVSGSIPPPSSTSSRPMVILWVKPAFSSTVWTIGKSHTGPSSQNRVL